MTGEGKSVERSREAKLGEVGDACGERRRAKDEMGVNDAAGRTLRRSREPPRERRAGRGGTGGMESSLPTLEALEALRLPDEERREEELDSDWWSISIGCKTGSKRFKKISVKFQHICRQEIRVKRR